MNEYNWIAHYDDGTTIAEKEGKTYRDIDRSRLKTFQLFDNENLKFSLTIHDGQRLIFRRRKTVNMSGQTTDVTYLVGYQFNDSTGKNYKVISYVHNNGMVELDDDRSDLVVLPEEN